MNRGLTMDAVAKGYLSTKRPPRFMPGDAVKVHLKIKEGDKERIQIFEGVVIARRGGGVNETFKVRRIASGVGVERTFLLHSPSIHAIKVVKHGDARRAKLYYLRGKTGKHAKIRQLRRDKLLVIQAAEIKAMEAEQEESARQAALEASAKEQAKPAPGPLSEA